MVDAGGLNPPDEKSSCGFDSRPGHAANCAGLTTNCMGHTVG